MKRLICVATVLSLLVPSLSLSAQSVTVPDRDYWFRFASRLPIGSTVRVRTSDGTRQTAVLTLVDEESITLQPTTRVPEPPRRIPFDQLEQLELRPNNSSLGKAIAIGVASGAGAFFGVMLIMLAAFSD